MGMNDLFFAAGRKGSLGSAPSDSHIIYIPIMGLPKLTQKAWNSAAVDFRILCQFHSIVLRNGFLFWRGT